MVTNFRSNADHTRLISKSIFVTNFPDNTSSKDLWKLCQDYGTVVDVYIPNRKSKAGKRFAFVRFIKVENIDRLVGNLCTLWIGRMHLHANVVRFEGSPIQASRSASSARPNHIEASSFATVLKGNNTPVNACEAPAMVIDDSCVVARDLEFFVMGEVKKFSFIPNLRVLLAKELFAWSPVFNEVKEVEYCTDDESVQGTNEDKGKPMNDKEKSQDPFNFYDLLRKRDGGVDTLGSDISIPYPPGFTLEKLNNTADVHEVQHTDDLLSSGVRRNGHMPKKGGSVLEVLEEMIKVRQTMGYTMEGCMKDMENIIGSQGAQDVNFLSLQETKMESIFEMDVKILWGNSNFEYLFSEAIGNSAGIICTWDPNIFLKEQHILSDNFVALFGTWIPTKTKFLMISIYAPQPRTEKRSLWNYIMYLVTRWQGDSIVMGDFNEVRSADERMGSIFNIQGATDFNDFISNSGLVDIQLEGYSFTWSHPSASKMSKLDRFLVTKCVILLFPYVSAICLDRHLSDHRPILLRDVIVDYGATPFRLYHSWLTLSGFEQLVIHTWNSTILEDSNGMVRFKKKLQALKKAIREWVAVYKQEQTGRRNDIKLKLSVIDKKLDQGRVNDDILLSRMGLMKQLLDNGEWVDDPRRVKEEYCSHFATRFHAPSGICNKINFQFPNQLSSDQAFELEKQVSTDEIRTAVWACGESKSPGPDGFMFEYFRKFWDTIGPDLCLVVEWFFVHGSFSRGCNSLFIALIPKVQDSKFVNDYRPISLIGSLYKVVTKILALRLSSVIAGLISDV
nr:RNA-directed DNA polymerase, eukaryota [Tanacetum cinerariifolium]